MAALNAMTRFHARTVEAVSILKAPGFSLPQQAPIFVERESDVCASIAFAEHGVAVSSY